MVDGGVVWCVVGSGWWVVGGGWWVVVVVGGGEWVVGGGCVVRPTTMCYHYNLMSYECQMT